MSDEIAQSEKTDYIALIPNAWGVDEQSETLALLNALRNYSWKERKKPVPYMICEASRDWNIDGFGTVTAKTVKKIAEGEISLDTAQKVWCAWDALEEGITYVDDK